MKIHEMSAKIIASNTDEPAKLIEKVGRLSYRSQDKTTEDSHKRFLKMIVNRKHDSLLEQVDITMLGITNRGVTHELVRHRLASYNQSSTRYIDETNMQVIRPSWLTEDKFGQWETAMLSIEKQYQNLLELGCTRQEARGVLPNDLMAEIVVKMNLRQWMHLIKQRIQRDCHPDMVQFARLCLENLVEFFPELFNLDRFSYLKELV